MVLAAGMLFFALVAIFSAAEENGVQQPNYRTWDDSITAYAFQPLSGTPSETYIIGPKDSVYAPAIISGYPGITQGDGVPKLLEFSPTIENGKLYLRGSVFDPSTSAYPKFTIVFNPDAPQTQKIIFSAIPETDIKATPVVSKQSGGTYKLDRVELDFTGYNNFLEKKLGIEQPQTGNPPETQAEDAPVNCDSETILGCLSALDKIFSEKLVHAPELPPPKKEEPVPTQQQPTGTTGNPQQVPPSQTQQPSSQPQQNIDWGQYVKEFKPFAPEDLRGQANPGLLVVFAFDPSQPLDSGVVNNVKQAASKFETGDNRNNISFVWVDYGTYGKVLNDSITKYNAGNVSTGRTSWGYTVDDEVRASFTDEYGVKKYGVNFNYSYLPGIAVFSKVYGHLATKKSSSSTLERQESENNLALMLKSIKYLGR